MKLKKRASPRSASTPPAEAATAEAGPLCRQTASGTGVLHALVAILLRDGCHASRASRAGIFADGPCDA
jgi:hypothetical protein